MQPLPAPPRLDPERTALFLDIDGTLAELQPRPSDVGPDVRRTELLRRVGQRLDGRLAVLSGRSLAEVDHILDFAVQPVAAVHGLVRRESDGVVAAVEGGAALDAARRELRAFAEDRPGVLFEDKGVSLGLHYRLAPEAGPDCEILARRLAARHQLQLQPGSMVLELRIAGPDKGEALRRFLQTPQFQGRQPIMVGDDLTDESAFAAAAAAGGYGVLVGAARPTHAAFGLPSVGDVLDWLAQT